MSSTACASIKYKKVTIVCPHLVRRFVELFIAVCFFYNTINYLRNGCITIAILGTLNCTECCRDTDWRAYRYRAVDTFLFRCDAHVYTTLFDQRGIIFRSSQPANTRSLAWTTFVRVCEKVKGEKKSSTCWKSVRD